MSIHDWNDLTGIRLQIIANAAIAFPLMSPQGFAPNRFNIIVRANRDGSHEAVIVYGPTNRVFAVGLGGATDKQALLKLLSLTQTLINNLYESGKLKVLAEGKTVDGLGLYDGSPSCEDVVVGPQQGQAATNTATNTAINTLQSRAEQVFGGRGGI